MARDLEGGGGVTGKKRQKLPKRGGLLWLMVSGGIGPSWGGVVSIRACAVTCS